MLYFMLNKPSGCVSANSDPALPTVMELFPKELRACLHPVGRLDRDTEGLLLITDDGELSFRLTRPEFGIPKRYFFRAFGRLGENDIKKIEGGGALFGNGEPFRPAKLSDLSAGTVLGDLLYIPEDKRRHCLHNPAGPTVSGVLTVTEGKRHEVKLILRSAGCSVFYLKRLSIGGIELDEKLEPGKFRLLSSEETALAMGYRERYIDNIGKTKVEP